MSDKVTLATVNSFKNDTSAVAITNNNSSLITTAMDNTLSRDGTQPNQMNNNLDMNSNQIINLPPPMTANSAARLQDLANLQGGSINLEPLPTGGLTGYYLAKNSSANYDAGWFQPQRPSINLLTQPYTIYVSTTGNDSTGDGSAGNPFRHISGNLFNTLGFKDLGVHGVVIQLVGSPWNESVFMNMNAVGGKVPQVIIQGNPSNPSSIVMDGTGVSGNAIILSGGTNTSLNITGIQFQNWNSIFAVSNNSIGGQLSLGNLIFNNNNFACVGAEGPGTIVSGSAYNTLGFTPNTIKFTGFNDAMFYCAFGGYVDLNDTILDCTSSPTFGTGLFNLDDGGVMRYWGNVTGTPQGPAFKMNTGSHMHAFSSSSGGTRLASSAMPGTLPGINFSGDFNNERKASLLGYEANGGIGGAVTQSTNKSTTVTLNNICGQITMNNASLAAGASVLFNVINNTVKVNDNVIVNVQGGTTTAYNVTAFGVANGGFNIQVQNIGTTASDAIILNFSVIKSANN